MKAITAILDDFLLLAGCGCLLYGLSLWSIIITWIVGGLILIGLAIIVSKAKANHAAG